MLRLIRYLKGYLLIKVWGFSTERFMNLCSNHNIFLWNIKNYGSYYTMCISLKGFYELRSITRKTGTRVVIAKRYGLPFLLPQMKKRKIFMAGLIGSLFFWIWMMGYIWNIEIQGNFYVTQDVFMDFLRRQGIESGIKKSELDIEALEKAIRNEYSIVTWTSAQVDGTKLVIQIKENDLITREEEKEIKEEGYDLVADKAGTVVSIITRNGVPKVKEGELVEIGDVLVEGSIPIYNEDSTIRKYEYCEADADILIRRSMQEKEEIAENYEKKVYTGREKKRNSIMIHQFKMQLPLWKKEYEEYDVIEEKTQLCLFDSLYLPIYFCKDIVREYKTEESVYTKEEIKIKFEQKIQKIMQTLEEKGVQIIEKNVTIKKYKGIWKMQVDFVVVEKTGTLKKTQTVLPDEAEQGE